MNRAICNRSTITLILSQRTITKSVPITPKNKTPEANIRKSRHTNPFSTSPYQSKKDSTVNYSSNIVENLLVGKTSLSTVDDAFHFTQSLMRILHAPHRQVFHEHSIQLPGGRRRLEELVLYGMREYYKTHKSTTSSFADDIKWRDLFWQESFTIE